MSILSQFENVHNQQSRHFYLQNIKGLTIKNKSSIEFSSFSLFFSVASVSNLMLIFPVSDGG